MRGLEILIYFQKNNRLGNSWHFGAGAARSIGQ